MIFSIISFFLEFTIGIVFIVLWQFFSKLTRMPSFGVSRKQVIFVNILVSVVIILYFFGLIVFELIDSVMTYRYWKFD